MPRNCVAVGCTNHQLMGKEGLTFHIFPDRVKNNEKWKRWVQAIKRVNADGSAWHPGGRYAFVCSDHFIGGKPSKDPNHPDYIPSVFKHDCKEPKRAEEKLRRFERAQKRRDLREHQHESKKQKIAATEEEEAQRPSTSGYDPSADHQNVNNSNVPEAEDKTKTFETEMKFLMQEKAALLQRVTCLEQQVMMAKFDPLIIQDDATAKYLTGLSTKVFQALCNLLVPHIPSPRKNLPPQNQILMVLVRLRLNLPFEYLSMQTGLSQSTLNTTFWKLICLMYAKLKFLVRWPDRSIIKQTLPPTFKQSFPRLTSIIDCFEIFIERPHNLKARAQVYSNYKKHSTVKYLISCSPLGAVTFLSDAWGGRATDIQIVRGSGFISSRLHEPGDQILADRGFTLTDDFAAACGAELLIPSFTRGRTQLTAREVETTRKIANVRIHVERVIGLIKKRYAILQGTMPISLIKSLQNEVRNEVPDIDKLVTVCAGLINLAPGIVYSESEQ